MIRDVSTLWLCAVLACFASAADAQNVRAVRKQIEGSMLVTGRVTITREGTVGDWSIDRREDLPPAVLHALRERYSAYGFDDDATLATIAAVKAQAGRILDPHTAVAASAGRVFASLQGGAGR